MRVSRENLRLRTGLVPNSAWMPRPLLLLFVLGAPDSVLETPDWILGLDESYASEAIGRAARRFEDVNRAILEQAESRIRGERRPPTVRHGDDLPDRLG